MRLLTSIVIVVALVVCLGCAKQEAVPAEQQETAAEAQVDSAPIAEEDFEAGEVTEPMTVGEEEADEGGDTSH